MTDRLDRDPSTAQGPEDPSRDLLAVGRRVRSTARADRARLTARAGPWAHRGHSVDRSTVPDRPSETASVGVAEEADSEVEEAALETDQVCID